MGAYLSLVSGAIKLFNAIASALQQHHDELNGSRAQQLKDAEDELDAIRRAASAAADPAAIQRVRSDYQIDRSA